MSDEYVKTVVITDPNYRPGELRPAEPVEAPKGNAEIDTSNNNANPGYPEFSDTSWLT